ncbi:MAG TPA: ABC transporter ATP-binding protein [Candidatus Magasanikbacteria bacterium]|nr:ABC transporter ATP-binding protein [Candidatus Magasanikbacteria bacterium]
MTLIEAKDLCKEYVNEEVKTPVLHDLNFKIEEGEFVAIMGPSGSGKSTLMHILSFLDKISCGKYLFKGKDVSEFNDDQLAQMRSKEVGFIFQAFNLLPRTTVLENVMLPLLYDGVSNNNIRIYKAKQALINVGLDHRLNYFTNQLSGGEKQRVAIARALVNDPSVIFADEPTGNLDSKSGLQVMKILQSLNEEGKTIILVTHERYTAEHAKRILRIKDGVIESDEKVVNRQFAQTSNELIK